MEGIGEIQLLFRIRGNDAHLGGVPGDAVYLSHEMRQVPDMLQRMRCIYEVKPIVLEWKPLFHVRDHIDARKREAVEPQGPGDFCRPATKVQDLLHHSISSPLRPRASVPADYDSGIGC